jgi:dipeptidyl peptidase IV (DPP IV)-like protein
MHSKRCFSRFALVAFLLLTGISLEAQGPVLTTNWIATKGNGVADVPSIAWLEDGSAILGDMRLPAEQQTFEKLDPTTGKRHTIVDMKRAVESLKSFEPDTGIKDGLPWPETFNHAGTQALYLFRGDVFLLDLASSTFSRLTKTDSVEKDVQFSPDGRFVSFVRNNNIYVWDLTAGIATYARRFSNHSERHAFLGLLGRGLRPEGYRILVGSRLFLHCLFANR